MPLLSGAERRREWWFTRKVDARQINTIIKKGILFVVAFADQWPHLHVSAFAVGPRWRLPKAAIGLVKMHLK
jgi:hypothetical protein